MSDPGAPLWPAVPPPAPAATVWPQGPLQGQAVEALVLAHQQQGVWGEQNAVRMAEVSAAAAAARAAEGAECRRILEDRTGQII
jgi:hypothetical protein